MTTPLGLDVARTAVMNGLPGLPEWLCRAMDCSRVSAKDFAPIMRAVFIILPGTHRDCRMQDKHTAAGYREQESEEGQAASIVAPAIGQAGLLILL